MKILVTFDTAPLVLCSFVALALTACNRGADSRQAIDRLPATDSQAVNPAAPVTVRGTVVSASAGEIVLKNDSATVTVKVAQPFHVYTRVPSDMSQVKATTFIGVTTVKQPDGSEQATEIHVFPEELRGLGEGSRMMTPSSASTSPSRMTNGAVTTSRMSNGNVATTNGSSLVVEYPGGSQTVTVPPNTPVTELKLSPAKLAAGDQVAALVKKAADGSFTSSTAILTTKTGSR